MQAELGHARGAVMRIARCDGRFSISRLRPALFLALTVPFGVARADGFDQALGHYRASPGCQGPARAPVIAGMDQAFTAWHLRDPVGPDTVALGRVAAARIDAVAAVEAAKGCKALALAHYRFVLRAFDGPVFANATRFATRGIRALRT